MTDWDFITDVRNKTLGFNQTQKETWTKEQVKKHLGCHIIIERKPIGFLAIKNDFISICIAPQFQGENWGVKLLDEIYRHVKDPSKLYTVIRCDNIRSFKVFAKAQENLD